MDVASEVVLKQPNDKNQEIMFKHIVMWRFIDGANGKSKAEHAQWVKEHLEALVGVIPEIVSLEVGINVCVAGTAYDGYLRWAYNSWVKNPLHDTRFRQWPAGDTSMVYPYGRSSVRFEKLVEGIQAYEKVRILREEFVATGNTEKLIELETLLKKFDFNSQFTDDFPTLIEQGRSELNALGMR